MAVAVSGMTIAVIFAIQGNNNVVNSLLTHDKELSAKALVSYVIFIMNLSSLAVER
jgi:hypothetical protein